MHRVRDRANKPVCKTGTQFHVCAAAGRQSERVTKREIQSEITKFRSVAETERVYFGALGEQIVRLLKLKHNAVRE